MVSKKLVEINDKGSLIGAQIQLDEFKEKLFMFDISLKNINKTKVDYITFQQQISNNYG